MKYSKKTQANNLFMLRCAAGLELKQVSRMLGRTRNEYLSAYEKGARNPNLRSLIKLSLIYKATLKEMYPELAEACRSEVEKSIRQRTFVLPSPRRIGILEGLDSCPFEERIAPGMSEDEKILVHGHVRKLAVKMNAVNP